MRRALKRHCLPRLSTLEAWLLVLIWLAESEREGVSLPVLGLGGSGCLERLAAVARQDMDGVPG
ncbi:MAG: hypothetical protein ABI587_17120 [Gemmatimonadales bacterium]